MACHALEGVVALVSCRADGYLDPTPSIHAKLRSMGARVATRLGKDVTHVIFNRRLNPSLQVQQPARSAAQMHAPMATAQPEWPPGQADPALLVPASPWRGSACDTA